VALLNTLNNVSAAVAKFSILLFVMLALPAFIRAAF